MYEYVKNLSQSIEKLITIHKEPLERTIELFAQSIIEDNILDNCVPTGDGLCEVNGRITGPFSSIAGMTLMNTICVEAQKRALDLGGQPLVFSSQNVDGFDNEAIYQHFGDRLKCR